MIILAKQTHDHSHCVQPWIDTAGRAVAHAIVSACALTDCRAVIIDGSFPRNAHNLLVEKVRRHITTLDVAGIDPPQIRRGTLGPISRALGAAGMPLVERFLPGGHMSQPIHLPAT